MIKIVTIIDKNYVTGSSNSADETNWDWKEELKKFHNIIHHQRVLMGASTFPFYKVDNLLKDYWQSFILTRNVEKYHDFKKYDPKIKFISDVKDIIKQYQNNNKEDLYILGGSQIWKEFFPFTEYLYIIKSESIFPGNLLFPFKDWSDFNLVKSEKHNNFNLEIYKRKP